MSMYRSAWWGPPKKFDRPEEERKVSWLELFYDLVYVIAISRITHQLALETSLGAFIEYTFLFTLIFWGWLNGSMYHDLHGNEGLRTRLMTLWQMMIIAALAVEIELTPMNNYRNITVVFMIMQLYITYMWWSIGFYDRSHRRYNMPYTILYLLAFALMGASMFFPVAWLKAIVPVILVCNYAPPFIAQVLLRRDNSDLNLSPSMAERLGLFAIIVFGEVVLGVVNGISNTGVPGLRGWLNFALAISIVFSLWWIFFTLVAQRLVKRGFNNASRLELLYIPSLISLGLIAVSFTSFFEPQHEIPLRKLGYAIAVFLGSVSLMMNLLVFPPKFIALKKPAHRSLLVTAAFYVVFSLLSIRLNRLLFLIVVLSVLLAEIIYLNSMYYRVTSRDESENH
jgi:low temperature requirement protein LtrA